MLESNIIRPRCHPSPTHGKTLFHLKLISCSCDRKEPQMNFHSIQCIMKLVCFISLARGRLGDIKHTTCFISHGMEWKKYFRYYNVYNFADLFVMWQIAMHWKICAIIHYYVLYCRQIIFESKNLNFSDGCCSYWVGMLWFCWPDCKASPVYELAKIACLSGVSNCV